MSTTVGLYGASGTSYVLGQGVKTLTAEQQSLAAQTSSGVKGETYADIGDTRSAALSLQPQITAVSTWQSSVAGAQTSLSVTQTALKQIQSIASNFSNSLLTLSGSLGQSQLQTVVETAKSDLEQVGNLLNTQSGSDYVFAGQNSVVQPVTDPGSLATGTLATETASVVATLDTAGADSVMQQATALAASNDSSTSVFSSEISVSADSAVSQESSAVVGPGTTVTVGMVATEGTAATSDSTGSPVRDLLRNLMVVASLGSADMSSSSVSSLISSLQTSTSGIASDLTTKEASLGISQDNLTSQSSLLTSMSTVLSTQLDNAKGVDWAELSVQTSQIQEQLQASYSLIADMKSMTLASYI